MGETDFNFFEFIIDPGGNIASIIGLVITLFGFGFTIRNVLKSKQLVLEVRKDIKRVNAVSELSAAISAMDEIKRLHRVDVWILLPDRYSALKKLLISIRSANPDLSNDQKTILQNAIQHFTSIEDNIEKAIVTKQNPSNIAQLNKVVSKQIDNLLRVLVEIQNSIGE